MCRNIKTLHNFKPPATEEQIKPSSLQFVRKLSGLTRPSEANQVAFDRAVDEVAAAARGLLDSLVTDAPPRHREVEAAKARARTADRFRTSVTDALPSRSGGDQRRSATIALRRHGALKRHSPGLPHPSSDRPFRPLRGASPLAATHPSHLEGWYAVPERPKAPLEQARTADGASAVQARR